jgi:hypothetical protein
MSKNKSDGHVPSDWKFLGSLYIIPVIGLLAAISLPAMNISHVIGLYQTALGLGCMGIILLFLARLPLYRQRRFFTFGPKALPLFHRKLYWCAYAAIIPSIFLLLTILSLLATAVAP